jgi:ribulose-phosphate 3-epimerase
MAKIFPSILSADFVNLQAELQSISAAEGVHIDVMDGHFVPNLTLGMPVVKRICEVTDLYTDVHLMIDNPDSWAPSYAALGASSVTFHLEAAGNPARVISDVQLAGASAAIAIKPETPVELLSEHLSQLQMVLVMTVEPGYGGQQLIPETLTKVSCLRDQKRLGLFKGSIQVDGGINASTIRLAAEAGAEIFVAGSAVFSSTDRAAAIRELRGLATPAG